MSQLRKEFGPPATGSSVRASLRRSLRIALLASAAWSAIGGPASAKSLQEAVRDSLNFHPALHEQGARARATVHGISEARSGYLPTLDLNGDAGFQVSNNPSTRGRASAGRGSSTAELAPRQASLIGRQLIFDGFGTPSRIDQATAVAGSARHQYVASGEIIGLRAVQAYLDVLRFSMFVQFAEENVAEHKDLVTQIRRRASGPSTAIDATQADSRLALAVANLEARRGDLEDAKVRYLETIGELPVEVEQPLRVEQVELPDIADAVQVALSNSPAVQSTSKQIEAAQSATKVAQSPFWPRFDLEVGGSTGEDLGGVRNSNQEAHARVLLRYNLVNGGGDLARTRRAEEELNAARLADAESRRVVRENVRLAIEDVRSARARLEPLSRHRQTIAEVLAAYRSQFEIGRRTLLDVLDVVNEKYNSRVSFYDEEIRLLLAHYQLLAASGRLLSTFDLAVPEQPRTP